MDVEILVDGKRLDLNDFVKKITFEINNVSGERNLSRPLTL